MSAMVSESPNMDVVEVDEVKVDDDFENLQPEILSSYKSWKKNTPFLYDLVLTHSLEWPSLTIEWHPDVIKRDNREIHKTEINAKNYRHDLKEVGSYGGSVAKVDIKVKMAHDGEVHRARVNPHNRFQIATKSPQSSVFVFDYSKQSSLKSANEDAVPKPQHICTGHSRDGWGLDWCPTQDATLLSGSDDATICLWDLREAGLTVPAYRTWNGHNDVVEDVAWHKFSSSLFGSVGDDSKLIIWDTRKEGQSVKEVDNAHKGHINCLSFNSFNENFFATGGSDGKVNVWDLRYLQNPVNSLATHNDAVYQVSWSPHCETMLASGSEDRRICIYDLAREGDEQTPEQEKEGPPELVFIHGGHTSEIKDFSWNPTKPFTISSISEGHIMQVWTMTESHYLRKAVPSSDVADDDLESTDNVSAVAEQLSRAVE
eukprot:GSChrysophyteH1.ASY1.ANO1.2373.1 assembled CDS